MSKGKQLLDEFLSKLGKSLNDPTWDNLTAGWDARKRLDDYLDPPRDEKGHWLSQRLPQTSSQHGGEKNATAASPIPKKDKL